ncbi:Zn-ribbon domain-containing protein [Halapricum desulfuricans]|uniref:Zn-ribbon containing protein n=1 Tax=Halapricum desulfuricans TaxID=2841257 RepID=A0A897NAJ4_9EURY|nr:Zn-ribbon domain-containing protein [Halapricum desulfuricans]QSG07416.1 Zn-ribbon containing protein [Halapricum desulfuricans]
MPHQCTACGHVFEDGSKEMLSGCPECGGTKFQFHPEGADIPEQPPGDAEPPDRPESQDSVAGTVGNAAATVRNLVGGSSTGNEGVSSSRSSVSDGISNGNEGRTSAPSENVALDDDSTAADGSASDDAAPAGGPEDAAQASARSDVVDRDELPEDGPDSPERASDDATAAQVPDESDRPDLSELREELNDQFESIKVVEPGQYELNLMELYDREEYIIALQEDGKYSIQVPDRWQD